MANGVSCAYFAARNLVYGTKEKNIFKEGIAAAQTTRTVNAVANSSLLNAPVSATVKTSCSKVAKFAKKILYPLIIASGVYNTVRSDDKVKTGCSQAAGIGTMLGFEIFAEKKVIPHFQKALTHIEKYKPNSKAGRAIWYVLKGATFATFSLAGYETGSKVAEKLVDFCRGNKAAKVMAKETFEKPTVVDDVFSDMIL